MSLETSLFPHSIGLRKTFLWCWASRCHYNEQIYGGKIGEKEKRWDPRVMKKDKTEVRKAITNRLLWVTCLPPGTRMTSRAKLLSVKGHVWFHGPAATSLSWCRWLLLPLRALQMPGFWAVTRDHVVIRGPGCHWGHTDLGSLCYHPGQGITWAWTAAEFPWLGPWLCCHLGICWCPYSMLPKEAMGTICDEIWRTSWSYPTFTGTEIACAVPQWTLKNKN